MARIICAADFEAMQDKVDYWIELCDDDLRVAKNLFASRDYLWMGFICHLIVEKALKAVLARRTDEIPPKTHHLLKLASKANISEELSELQKLLLAKLMPLQIEARHPEHKAKIAVALTESYCVELLKETEEFLCWIKKRLGI